MDHLKFPVLLTLLAVLPAAPAASGQCTGDCGADRFVTVEEIVRGVNIALGNVELSMCPQFDSNDDDGVTVEELLQAIQNALNGCPPIATATPTETPTSAATATASAESTATETPTTAEEPTVAATATEIASTPTATATATSGSSAMCGNGFIEPGETCEGCAGDCQISPCTVSGTQTFHVFYVGSRSATSLSLLIGYRSSLVSLPGMANQATVGARVTERPPGTFIVNDLNYGLRTVLGGSNPKPPGKLYAVQFDRCQGGPAPTAADFGCTVEGCTDGFGAITGCTCSVVAP